MYFTENAHISIAKMWQIVETQDVHIMDMEVLSQIVVAISIIVVYKIEK
jgi:hypothetical protein